MTDAPASLPAAFARPAEEVAAALGTTVDHGLDADEAARRLAAVGPNRLAEPPPPSRLAVLAEQLTDVLILVLAAAAAVSGIVLGEWVDAAVILAIVVLNASLGYLLRRRAEAALAAVRELGAPDTRVVRDSTVRRVPAHEVVPGDVVVLEAGDRVAADARLVVAVDLTVDESTLTGESVPVTKSPDVVGADVGLADRTDMVFLGTVVRQGRGRGVVTATGAATEVGRIATLAESEPVEPSPLQQRLATVGRRLAALAGLVAIVVFGIGVARGIPTHEMFLTAVALAVASIPEGLPAAVTITLALGVQRLARSNALVRRLPAVETLGSATVICTDKTGTLTRNVLEVAELRFPDGDRRSAGEPPPPGWLAFARVASLCTDADPLADSRAGDPTEVALLHEVVAGGADPRDLRARHPRLGEVAFDSSRKRMTTLHRDGRRYLLAVKGAPETVLARCSCRLVEGVPVALDDQARAALHEASDELAAQGLRTLLLAERPLDEAPAALGEAEHDLCVVALVGMLDDLRAASRPAVETARRAGVRVVMITGDHAATAGTIAAHLGLVAGRHEVLAGPELRRLDPADLAGRVTTIGAYARVDPADKLKIIDAWRSRGDVVAMTGDGVNDAPALRAADIGIAMGSGTDVAKEAAELVLLDDDFATIVRAVSEGRTIFANLQKIIFFLLAANIAEILVVAVGLLAATEGAPLLAVQLLWMNLVTDGPPVLALAVDRPPHDLMDRPPVGRQELLSPQGQVVVVARGAVLAVATLSAMTWTGWVHGLHWEDVRTVAFTTLVLAQLAYAFVVRRVEPDGRSVHPRPNHPLLLAVTVSALLQVLVVETPTGQHLFGTVGLDAATWAVVVACSLIAVPVLLGAARRRAPT